MGRHKKKVLTDDGVDRRENGYYSTPSIISDFICDELLSINPEGESLFDPCIGKGEMVLPFKNKIKNITGVDIVNYPTLIPDVNFKELDFIDFYLDLKDREILGNKSFLQHDYWVANPPYNCHEINYIRANKKKLQSVFGGGPAHNMYSMFLWAIIDLAKPGALIGIITLDSFLTAKAHSTLRKFIIENCLIHKIILCPTDLFLSQRADVRTCVLILQKLKSDSIKKKPSVKLCNRAQNILHFKKQLDSKDFVEKPLEEIILSGIEDNDEFLIDVPDSIVRLFRERRLGKLFPCITGISTGNDIKYLSKEKRLGFSIPFYKNPASRKFYTEPDGFLIDSYLEIAKSTPNFMVRNLELMSKGGITCSSMGVPFSAAYLPTNATFGVNANIIVDDSARWWLMAYLNSSLATFIVRRVLNRSNMITSGYVGRIPIPSFSEKTLDSLSTISKKAFDDKVIPPDLTEYIQFIDDQIFKELKFTTETEDLIKDFAKNPILFT